MSGVGFPCVPASLREDPAGRCKIPELSASVAPLGLIPYTQHPPTAHAVGYRLSALRAWSERVSGAEHRKNLAVSMR